MQYVTERYLVYAVDVGAHTAGGMPSRKFGKSSLSAMRDRLAVFRTTALIEPRLCGVILCNTEAEAFALETEILHRFASANPIGARASEMRLATPSVLEFIKTEMADGAPIEAIVKADTIEFVDGERAEVIDAPEADLLALMQGK